MKRVFISLLSMIAVIGLILGMTSMVESTLLFNDEDQTSLNVRADGLHDYAYHATSGLYGPLRDYEIGENDPLVIDPDPTWYSVSLPFAGTNANSSSFDVYRNYMESMRFYLICDDNRFNDHDDVHFQIDNVKLTKDAGGELLIDDFSGSLQWSYQEHPSPSSPPHGSVSVTIDSGVLDIYIDDMYVRDSWEEINYIDIFSSTTNDATDSFIFGNDWSAYDNLEFEWQVIEAGTNRDYVDLRVRTDAVPIPRSLLLLASGLFGMVSIKKKSVE